MSGLKGSEADPLKMLKDLKLPAMVDTEAVLATYRRNIEALSAANRVALEGAQTVAKRHMEILQQTMSELTENMQALSAIESPHAKAAKQAELLKRAYERAVANTKELSDLIRDANAEALRALRVELGALECEPLTGESSVVLLGQLGDRAGARRDTGRGDRFEKRSGDGLVEPPAAECLAGRFGAVEVEPAHARIPNTFAVVAGIRHLHPPAAPSAAQQPLQQRAAFAGGAATFTAGSHVRPQPLAVLEVVLPADIAGMVIGQADRPLLDRHLERPDMQLPVGVDALLLAGAAEHERAGIDRVGQQLLDRAIARTDPPHAALANRPAWEALTIGDHLPDDLPGGTGAAPQLKDALDRVPDLLVGAQDDLIVLVAVKSDREVHRQLTTRGLVPQPAV